MILCPYVYLLTDAAPPPLRLQPTEIASAHWVPLRALRAPAQLTHEAADVSARLLGPSAGLARHALRLCLGHMLYRAVRLLPSESVVCSSNAGFVPTAISGSGGGSGALAGLRAALGMSPPSDTPPLHLWGLTLGVVADLLALLPPPPPPSPPQPGGGGGGGTPPLAFWTYPTFSPPDVRACVWALSWRFRRRKARELGLDPHAADMDAAAAPAAIELGMGQVEARGAAGAVRFPGERHDSERRSLRATGGSAGAPGFFRGSYPVGVAARRPGAHSSAVTGLLDGYFVYLRRGVVLALVGRVGAALAVAVWVWRYRRRRRTGP